MVDQFVSLFPVCHNNCSTLPLGPVATPDGCGMRIYQEWHSRSVDPSGTSLLNVVVALPDWFVAMGQSYNATMSCTNYLELIKLLLNPRWTHFWHCSRRVLPCSLAPIAIPCAGVCCAANHARGIQKQYRLTKRFSASHNRQAWTCGNERPWLVVK